MPGMRRHDTGRGSSRGRLDRGHDLGCPIWAGFASALAHLLLEASWTELVRIRQRRGRMLKTDHGCWVLSQPNVVYGSYAHASTAPSTCQTVHCARGQEKRLTLLPASFPRCHVIWLFVTCGTPREPSLLGILLISSFGGSSAGIHTLDFFHGVRGGADDGTQSDAAIGV